MAKVKVYTKQGCPFSERARDILEEKGIPYDDIDTTDSPELQQEMIAAAGGRYTTPQVFIDGEHIGGADDLEQADRAGRLAGIVIADHALSP
jgi:glutaredoxin 3